MTSAARANVRAKTAEPETERTAGRILAIDYGRKRIGLAVSDELGAMAHPLLTLHRTNRRDDIRRLREICARNHVGHIVVGHPLHMTGEAGEMAEEAARFAERLTEELGIETELLDERLTTWEAKQTMSETKPRSRRKGESIDAIAAAVLLREYLESRQEASRRKRSRQQ
jgi:putative pre-16S rRNA nuclease